MALKHVVLSLALHNVAAGVGTALPPYKHRRGFFARGGGFAVGMIAPATSAAGAPRFASQSKLSPASASISSEGPPSAGAAALRIEPAVPGVFLRRVVSILLML